jgi:hypothetical protein
VGRPKKYHTETQRQEGRRKRQREFYAAHRETISAKRAKRSRERAERKLLAVPQTAGKAIEPGTVFFVDTATRGSAADD